MKWQKASVPQTREEFLKTFERRMPPKRTVAFHMEPMFDVEEE